MGRFENLEISIKQKPSAEDIAKNYDEYYYLNCAQSAWLNGDFEAALRYYSRALSYRIDIPEAWVGQVLCLIYLGELDEAIIWADKGIELISASPDLLAVKAMALGRKGEFERALSYSDQAIKKTGNSALRWVARGDIIIISDIRSAELCFKKAIECGKDNPQTYINIGVSYLTIKDSSSALGYLKKALELCPKSPFINFLIGKAYQMSGMLDNAKRYYENALKHKPDYQECIEAYRRVCEVNIFVKLWMWLKNLLFK